MVRNDVQRSVTEFLADLPEEEYMSALIVVRYKNDSENGNGNFVGFEGSRDEYMQCLGALAENGANHGYLAKTIPLK